MVMARLHIICGNCGCNDELTWQYVEEEREGDEVINPETVWIWCENCGTLHDIDDNADHREP